mgnify:CR=1 FL=1
MKYDISKNCGYGSKFVCKYNNTFLPNDVHSNIRKIHFLNSYYGMQISTCNVEDFFDEAVAVPSKYNPPKMATMITHNPKINASYAISNIRFKQNNMYKTIQFVCEFKSQ